MERFKSTILVMLVVFGLLTTIAEAKSPSILLQEGLYAEETEGDLDKAISLYGQVLEQYRDVERPAAQATYHLGMCYLKKGEKEMAAKYFQEVVSYFPQQTSTIDKARSQLSKLKPLKEGDFQAEIISYLFSLHMQAYSQAKKEGIALNSIAYYVEESFVKIQGGFLTFENTTGAPIDSEITVGNFGRKNITDLYNEKFALQQMRFEDTGEGLGRYALKWTPDSTINPGEIKTLIYTTSEDVLPRIGNGCRLEMKNHFGSEVLENFFVILPSSTKITTGLDNITSHKRINNYDIYQWQKRVPENTINSRTLDIEINKEYSDAEKPAVIDSFPLTYSTDVDPDIKEISVTFDQDMHRYGWSWCQINQQTFPETTGKSKYIDARTCVLPVKVAPGRSYLILINLSSYEGFQNVEQIPAREYAIVFATKDENGNPTEIPVDLFTRAEDINTRNALPDPVLDIVPASVRSYIANKFYETYEKAQEKGLSTNSHVKIIDQDLNRHFGMIQIYKNKTDKVIDHEIAMGSNDSPEMYVYDEKGVRQKIRTHKKPGSNYRYFWTPSEPVEPGEARMLLYSTPSNTKLYFNVDGKYSLRMQNQYGSPVIEDFYVVLPSNVEVVEQSEPYTSVETIDGFKIYCWSKEQKANVRHRVDIKLEKTD